MKIIIGSDHRGHALKEVVKKHFSSAEWLDIGVDNGNDRADYPVVAKKACTALLGGDADRAVLVCGSGVGVSIAANRYAKVYAALCWSPEVAQIAREHDYANVLALPADFVDSDTAIRTVQAWLDAEFLGGRYKDRLDMLERSNS